MFTFGYSLNQGIASAQADLIVIASAHVYPVYPDWLESLLAPFKDAQVGLAYGRQRGYPASKFSEQQIFERWYPPESQPRQYHPFCNNANAVIRRSLWQQHPYDETLPGLEDVAWARWLMAQGYSISYVAEAEVVHVHNETPHAVYNRYRREAMAFKRIFPDEHFHFATFLRLFASNAISDAWHAARKKSLTQSLHSIIWFRWMQFWGTYQGYRQSGPLTWRLRQTFYYPQGLISTNGHSVLQAQSAARAEPIAYDEKEK
jgi:GT2 family glycosyltransferase